MNDRKPFFTKKHYLYASALLINLFDGDEDGFKTITTFLSVMFMADNPEFDLERFLKSVGINAPPDEFKKLIDDINAIEEE